MAADKKSARRQNALIVFEDESGVSLLPSVRATWAPRGRTPVLKHRFGWKRLSLAGALVYESDASDAHLVFQLRPGAYNGETLIEFLNDLHQLEPQRVMVLIWDGLPAHRSHLMMDWIASQRDWLRAESLPGYAPELNPIEQVWGNLKSTDLANLCSDTIGAVAEVAEAGLERIGTDAPLCFAHACALYTHCKFDNNAVFGYQFVLSQISTWDGFHPNTAGQTRLASVTYAAGFNW